MKNINVLQILILLFWRGLIADVYAQEQNLSLYQSAPFLTNPGMLSEIEGTYVTVNYRSQTIEAGKVYTTSVISGYHSIQLNRHRLSVGVTFLGDKAADFLKTQGGILGLAYTVPLSRTHELTLGTQAGYFNHRLDPSFDYTTDSQFINGMYDGSAPTGEIMSGMSQNYLLLSTGLYWQMKDVFGRQRMFAGAAIFNYNKPNVGFMSEVALPASLKATAGWRVIQRRKYEVVPNMRLIRQSNRQLLSAGSWLHYDLGGEAVAYSQQLSLGVWYNSTKAGVFALEYKGDGMKMGLSYDIPMMSELNTTQKGGIFELAIAIRLKKKKLSAQIVNTTTSQEAQEIATVAPKLVEAETKQIIEDEPMVNNDEPIIPASKAGPVDTQSLTKEEEALLESVVRFDFGGEKLDANSIVFLDKVSVLLQNKKWINLSLTGHTCNIGGANINQKISLQRAEKVKAYLLSRGIAGERITTTGAGEDMPIEPNDSDEGRSLNRRVDFKVLEK